MNDSRNTAVHGAREDAVSGLTAAVVDHYGGDHDRASGDTLVGRIGLALEAAGLTQEVIPTAALAPLDQFHVGGLQSTAALAEAVNIADGERVIDIGSGLGGPSRYLANTYDCCVFGVDLSPSFVDAANFLAQRSGLADKVTYLCADAVYLPATATGFDVAWTQHVAMNIEDRAGLYQSVFNALRPGGRFAIYDIVAGEDGDPIYPLPWARTSATSFLLKQAAMRSALERTGFEVIHWVDRTADSLLWFEHIAAAAAVNASKKSPGLSLAMGDDFPQMTANLRRNLSEGRAGVVEVVVSRR